MLKLFILNLSILVLLPQVHIEILTVNQIFNRFLNTVEYISWYYNNPSTDDVNMNKLQNNFE